MSARRLTVEQIDVGGKMPPQATEIEDAVLGAILVDRNALGVILPILQPQHFYLDKNQYIYEAIVKLNLNNEPIDILTVSQQLKKNGTLELAGGDFGIAKLTARVSSSAHMENYAAIIIQKFMTRELISIGGDAVTKGYQEDVDVFELQAEILSRLENNRTKSKKDPLPLSKIVSETISKIQEIEKHGLDISGIDTGYKGLNSIMFGWHSTDFVVVAARPSTGKTAFALNIAQKIIEQNIPVAMFSLEMSNRQLAERMISLKSGVFANYIKKAKMNAQNWEFVFKQNYELPLYIDDTPGLNIIDFKEKCRTLKRKHKIKVIIIDYLQLMTVSIKGNREQEISTISRNLKIIAKELDVVVIALAQLSREVEKRRGQPILSDLRESGSIEQDADIVMFLHNTSPDPFNDDEPTIEIIFAKHRNGATGAIEMKFLKGNQQFKDIDTFRN